MFVYTRMTTKGLCLTRSNTQPPLPSYISHIKCILLTLARFTNSHFHKHSFLLLNCCREARRHARNSQAKDWVKKSWVTLVDKGVLDGEGWTTLLVHCLVPTISSPPNFGVVSVTHPLSFRILISCMSRMLITRRTLYNWVNTFITHISTSFTSRHPWRTASPFHFYTYNPYIFFDPLCPRLKLNQIDRSCNTTRFYATKTRPKPSPSRAQL